MKESNPPVARTRFFNPPRSLAPYLSMVYQLETAPDGKEPIADTLHPEWGNIRIFTKGQPRAAIGGGTLNEMPSAIVVGPTSRSTRFEVGHMCAWGIGILPLGWSKFFGPTANIYADRITDLRKDERFANFAVLASEIGSAKSSDRTAQTIFAFLKSLLPDCPEDDPAVAKAAILLTDPAIGSVTELAEKMGMTQRSFERLSKRAFGFTPKLLLRRQRFLRTLARVMLDPDLSFIESLDDQYYDQAHFARDFRKFMGMSARDYRALPKPIMQASVFGRMQAAGAAMQVLHKPD